MKKKEQHLGLGIALKTPKIEAWFRGGLVAMDAKKGACSDGWL